MIINGQKVQVTIWRFVVYIVQVRDPCAWLDTGCATFTHTEGPPGYLGRGAPVDARARRVQVWQQRY